MTEVLDEVREAERTRIVATSNGPVRGYRQGRLSIFKGLRYGAAPLGSLRFRPPRRPARWAEPPDALALGAPAIQVGVAPGETTGGRSAGDPPAPGQPGTDEDCLFLNVWTPGLDRGRRPVMVWLHGGGFANGSGGAAMYDGAALALRGDVVTVTVNHRLNVFGYLHLGELGGDPSSGQAGMLDIVQALEWVRDNIAGFGGDPTNVTIFGESGGGAKVSMLQAMPPAHGLFHKAIIQSGPGLRAVETGAATAAARALLEALKIAPGDLSRLETLAAAEIHAAAATVPGERPMGPFAPCIDGSALPRHPFDPDAPPLSVDIPVLIGTNKDEATLFVYGTPRFGEFEEADVLRRAEAAVGGRAPVLVEALKRLFPDYSPTHLLCQVQTVARMWANSVRLAERKAAQSGAPAYMYMLTWETPVARGALKCPHALEIPLVFDNVEAARNFVGRGEAPQRLAEQMAPAWLAFARTGDPNVPGLPEWPAYETGRRATMIFDLNSRIENDPWDEVRRIVLG
ncbi:MAG TPA: carboxylesterase family protein [Caulobacteraceae bacterium]|nr:carboxylesterase family protein [Caulobacteraceae bacterium]